jgi:hypothetical protein
MADIIVSSQVNAKNQLNSVWGQIKKIIRGIINLIRYNLRDLRYKWGWYSFADKFLGLFKTADITVNVGIWQLARSMKKKDFSDLLDDYLNLGGKGEQEGYQNGKMFHSKHRTIQACAVRFCMGFLKAIGEQEYTDARNEMPVAMCKKITKMVEDGELKMGYLI